MTYYYGDVSGGVECGDPLAHPRRLTYILYVIILLYVIIYYYIL